MDSNHVPVHEARVFPPSADVESAREVVAREVLRRLSELRPDWHARLHQVPCGQGRSIFKIQVGRSPESFVWITSECLARLSGSIIPIWREPIRGALGELLDPIRTSAAPWGTRRTRGSGDMEGE